MMNDMSMEKRVFLFDNVTWENHLQFLLYDVCYRRSVWSGGQ